MPGRILRASVLAFAALLLAACEPPTEPIEMGSRQLLIQAVLDATARYQMVSVAWTHSTSFQATAPVSNAIVLLTTPEGIVVGGAEDLQNPNNPNPEPGMYRIEWAGLFLRPGGTYTLRVITPIDSAGQTPTEATGTTTIPNVTPANAVLTLGTFERDRDTLRLSWPRVPAVKGYQVGIRSERFQNGQVFGFSTYLAFADTSITIAGTARTIENEPVFRVGTSAKIAVAAVDENYYAFYHPTVDPFAGAPPSRLTGALGFFGSIVPVLLRRYEEVR